MKNDEVTRTAPLALNRVVSSSAFIIGIDGWFIRSTRAVKILLTPRRHDAGLFEHKEALELKKRLQGGCGTAFLGWDKNDVFVIGENDKIPIKEMQTTLF